MGSDNGKFLSEERLEKLRKYAADHITKDLSISSDDLLWLLVELRQLREVVWQRKSRGDARRTEWEESQNLREWREDFASADRFRTCKVGDVVKVDLRLLKLLIEYAEELYRDAQRLDWLDEVHDGLELLAFQAQASDSDRAWEVWMWKQDNNGRLERVNFEGGHFRNALDEARERIQGTRNEDPLTRRWKQRTRIF